MCIRDRLSVTGLMTARSWCARMPAKRTQAAQAPKTARAFLSMFTGAGPGVTIQVKDNVLWPKKWPYPGTCDGAESFCSKSVQRTVDRDFPCDRRDTSSIEPCLVPTAVVQGPTQLSSCPDTPATLDASNSEGGGAKALSYQFSVDPTKTDNAAAIKAALEAVGDSRTATVQSEMNDGRKFVFLVRVSNFLGQTSPTT
eukprot:1964200-Prymnesium_polylepis.1